MNIGNLSACKICNRNPIKAVQANCCQAYYCLECALISSSQPCINCRNQPFTWKESGIARQMTSSVPYECPHCKEKMTMSEYEHHYFHCSSRKRKCDINNCTFEAPNDEFFAHLISNHKKELLLSFDKNAKTKLQDSINSSASKAKENISPLEKHRQKASIGTTGKHYCGGRLEGYCSCCNGVCGPDNGCNCRLCMALDIQSRGLGPGNWVNKIGSVSRSDRSGMLYCGEKAKGVIGINLRCEPFAKIQCKACKTLQSQIKDRYFGLN